MKLDRDLLELLELFRSNGVEFLVVGGHAVAFHGHPRLTEDLVLFVRSDAVNGQRIKNKRATGRTQDQADAEFLEGLEP